METQHDQNAEFGGECAFALSTGKKGVHGKNNLYVIRDGKKYLFSNPVAKFLFKILPGRREKAEQTWGQE